jgi:hypothetical protein
LSHGDVHRRGSVADGGADALGADLRRWIASGAVQGADGAFHAWLDAGTGTLAFAYPEITGYALTWLASLPDPTLAERDAGRRASEWLTARLESGNWSARDGWDDGAVYHFDLAMIATGLLTFGRVSSDARAMAIGSRVVAEIVRQQESDYPLDSVCCRTPASAQRSAWSTDGYAHLIKVAQCLLLGSEAGVPEAREAAARLVARAEEIQQPDGRFVTHLPEGPTMLHPHLYAVEGLWIYAEATGEAVARDRARRALQWAWSTQLDDGGLPRFSPGDSAPPQADLTAQAVRMGLVFAIDSARLERAYRWLESIATGDERGRALRYQAGVPHLNTWATLFGAQALSIAPDAQWLDWRVLV